ncbi:MAG: hypothetical protein IJP10_00860 [Clostridia bacterium]|nr:hypothetical protein [Clostridia bacterium]
MSTAAFIIGVIILSISVVGAAFLIVSALSVNTGKKENGPMALQQPMLNFLTEFDAADYLGVSLNELDFMRVNGMLEGAFLSLITLEQTGEEEYYDIVDGVEVVKTRPVMSNVTRYIFNREVLDQSMLNLMKDATIIDTTERKNKNNKKNNKKNHSHDVKKDNKENEKKADAPADDAEKKPEIVIEKTIEINPKKED